VAYGRGGIFTLPSPPDRGALSSECALSEYERSHLVGDALVTKVVESCEAALTPEYLFPDWTSIAAGGDPQLLCRTTYDALEGKLVRSVHSWLVRTPRHIVIIDTCSGDLKHRPGQPRAHGLETPYLQHLASAGVVPEEVDFVICTHFHAHHCGWNTVLLDGEWIPTFSRANYVFSKREFDYWSDCASDRSTDTGVYQDSILPVVRSGQAVFVDSDRFQLTSEVAIHPTPGHTPGHVAVQLTSRSATSLFAGDSIHHPAQIRHPQCNTRFCLEAGEAVESRMWLLRFAAEHRATIFTGHFPGSSAGRVDRVGRGFRWAFL
jgi:glyoxylase-like metal-dependent hydrolase (beta-lactamase superfamily II)